MLLINNLNGDYITRDNMIFGEYDEDEYTGGIRHFTCEPDLIHELLDNNFVDPEDCQNYSPYISEFLEVADRIPDCHVAFECYSVSPERDDYRISIEGIHVVIPDTDYDAIELCVESFNGADTFNFHHEGDSFFLHAWWD